MANVGQILSPMFATQLICSDFLPFQGLSALRRLNRRFAFFNLTKRGPNEMG
jgi:hypothetical protein